MRYNGTDGANKVTVTLAATASGPRFTVDDVVAVQAGAGCLATPGDATKVTCTAFKDSNGMFLRFMLTTGAGADVVTNATNTSTGQGVPMMALGGDGDDQLNGVSDRFAEEVLNGGPGADTLKGGPGGDSLLGGTGMDTLYGGESDDELYGGPDADKLFGEGGHSDALDGGAGPDLLDGGYGVGDNAVYLTRTASVSVDLALSGAVNGEAGEGDTITGIEDVIGGQGGDSIWGNSGDNNLVGSGGNDELHGRTGEDALVGGDGDDILEGNDNDMADGSRDATVGLDGFDICDHSTGDNDFFDSTCEVVFEVWPA
jgi:Ca2+-binding RTX toxin-like protein